jgi:iron complex transport system ATP-binding protein
MTDGPAVALGRVSARYGERLALADFSLTLDRGEFVALAGPNGSGKTTVLRTILGFLPPVQGSVQVLGDPVGRLSIRERARRIAWVPQEEGGREPVPLRDYVLYGRYAHHSPLDGESEYDRELVDRVLHEVGLEELRHRSILSLSGGERQRATLARALTQEAPVLLLDEPTSHLDIGHQIDLLERVRRLTRDRGVAVLAALHDLNLAARYADRIVVLSRGRQVASGTPRSVLSERLLAEVWGVDAKLDREPQSGLPYLIPRRLVVPVPPSREAPGRGPVHVVGGGGAAAPILRALDGAGYRVTTGALHLLDTDQEVADALGLTAAVEAPFAPLGETVRARHRELLASAAAIVIAPIAVGPSNLANLEDPAGFVAATPTFLVARPPIGSRDFAGGRAASAWAALVAEGAQEVPDLPSLLERIGDRLGSLATPTGPARPGATIGP